MPETKPIADILADSREFIERRGWVQHEEYDYISRKVCSIGGIIYSQRWYRMGSRRNHSAEIEAAAMALCQAAGISKDKYTNSAQIALAKWNDRPSRTVQEVLDLFAKAEKIERAGFDPDA